MDAWSGTLLAVFLGVVFVVLGLPLWKDRVKPNRAYGFRTHATLSDPKIWYAVNSRSGKQFVILGCALIVLGLAAIPLAKTETRQNVVLLAALAIMIAGIVYMIVSGYRLANDMAGQNAQDGM